MNVVVVSQPRTVNVLLGIKFSMSSAVSLVVQTLRNRCVVVLALCADEHLRLRTNAYRQKKAQIDGG